MFDYQYVKLFVFFLNYSFFNHFNWDRLLSLRALGIFQDLAKLTALVTFSET